MLWNGKVKTLEINQLESISGNGVFCVTNLSTNTACIIIMAFMTDTDRHVICDRVQVNFESVSWGVSSCELGSW